MTATTQEFSPLGHHEERFWPRDYGVPIEHRKAGRYEVFIPARIAEADLPLRSSAVNVITEATKALNQLQATRLEHTALGALARNLLRSESSASSRIEGVQISHKRLARAAHARAKGRQGDNRAAEVLGNVDAMERAIELGGRPEPLSVEDVLDIHRTLLRFTEDREIAGRMRDRQNWVGGNDWHPLGAAYIPPPPELVTELLEDLCAFANRTDLAPLAQASIAHAQFENIHPFADGNGRVGRALIYAVLRHRGEIPSYIPPISLALWAQPKNYVSGLGAYSVGRVGAWCELVAHATISATHEAAEIAAAVEKLQADWLLRLGSPRSDATVRDLVAMLPGQPIIDIPAGQQLTGKSHVSVGTAVDQMQKVGILRPLNQKRWGRVWECTELLTLVEQVEKRIATP
jgi:Fic family protein